MSVDRTDWVAQEVVHTMSVLSLLGYKGGGGRPGRERPRTPQNMTRSNSSLVLELSVGFPFPMQRLGLWTSAQPQISRLRTSATRSGHPANGAIDSTCLPTPTGGGTATQRFLSTNFGPLHVGASREGVDACEPAAGVNAALRAHVFWATCGTATARGL